MIYLFVMNRPLTDDIADDWFSEDRGKHVDSEEEDECEFDDMNDKDLI